MAKVLGFQIEINGTQRAISTSEELRRAIADIGKELKKATDVQTIQKLEKELIQLKARQNEVNKETRESIKLQQQQLTAVDKTSGAYDRLSKELNEARKRYKDLAAAEQDSTEEAQQLLNKIVQLDAKLKGIDGSVGQFQRNVGNYPSALGQLIPQFGGISQGIDSVRSASTGAGKAVGGLLIAFESFKLISGVVQELNANLEETRKISAQVQTFTKETGTTLENTVAITKALSKTYKEDTQEIINATNAASKELGVSFDEALLSLEIGLRKSANAQGEFLDSFREYPSQLGQAGFSLEEFTAIAIDAAEKGVYSDKAIDAVKEFGTQTREQTKSVRDSFISAFGEKFTNELFSNLNKGAISGRDALALVTKQINETGVAGKELQGLISTVFLGAGEDAGRYVLSLDQVLNATDQVLNSTTEYETQLNDLFQANLELEQATAGYNEALAGFSFELQVATAKGKTFVANVLKEILNFGNQLPATFAGLKAAFNSLGEFEINPVKGIKKLFTSYNTAFKAEVRKIKDEDEIQKAVVASLEKPSPRVQKAAQKTGQTIGKEVAKATREELEAQIEAKNLGLEKSARASFRAQISGIGEELQLVASQLNTQGFADTILSGLGSVDQIKGNFTGLADSIVAGFAPDDQGFEDLANKYELGFKKIGDKVVPTAKIIGGQIGGSFAKGVDSIAKSIIAFVDKFDIEGNLNRTLDAISIFQNIRAEKEQEAFDLEIERIDANIEALEEKQQNVGRIRQKQIQREIDAAKRTREAAEKQAEEAQKKAAKKEKNLAIIQATVQGALAVVRALAAPPGFPLNLPSVITTGVLAAAQVAAIAAQPLATGGVITGRRVTDNQNIPTRSNGDNVLATVRRGEVVLNERQQNALGGARTFRSIGVPGFAGGGIVPPITAPAAAMAGSGTDYLAALDRKTDAINQRIDRMRVYVVSEDVRADLAEGDALKAEATL